MAVIKSNAYGHGIYEVTKAIQNKVDWFGVDSIDEAMAISKANLKKPILILGYTVFERLAEVVKKGFSQVVANMETLQELEKICHLNKKCVQVHLKVETGTSRQGIFIKDLLRYCAFIKKSKYLKLAGLSTHYANIEDTTDHSYAQSQLNKFNKAVKIVESFGFKNLIKHTACSAASILFPETYFDMTRVGISLYGLWPSSETLLSARQKGIELSLKPCLTWKTKIAHIKTLAAGTPISYGCSEKLHTKTKVAVLPVGYYDGYDRGLSSIGTVLVKGKRCKILGRICMNMMIVDVSHVQNVTLEDEVVLLGQQKNEVISAEELAKKINTINYEIVARINPQIKRFVK